MPANKRRWFRISLRGVFAIFTVVSVALGWYSWQKSLVERRLFIASRLWEPDTAIGHRRGRAYEGGPGDWSIEDWEFKTLVKYPPRTTQPLSALRRWLGDQPFSVVVLRNDSACPDARDVFPEATIVVLNSDGASIRGIYHGHRLTTVFNDWKAPIIWPASL